MKTRNSRRSGRNILLGSAALLMFGCNSVELGFVPLFAVAPAVGTDLGGNTTCLPPNDLQPMALITLDTTQQSAFTMLVAAQNTMQLIEYEFETRAFNDLQTIPNTVQPVRFDYRWECDATGFTAGQGPIRLPAFGVDRPFCFDGRDGNTEEFSGFDVVPASGEAILPQTTGVIETRVVPPQMISQMNIVFDLAKAADACCEQAGGCTAAAMSPTSFSACQTLQGLFDQVDPSGRLNTNDARSIEQWRAFRFHSDTPGVGNPTPYTMRLRGRFEGLTPTGGLMTSTDFSQEIGFCQNCDTNLAVDVNRCLNR